jgi:hypothetical protein
MTNITPTAPIDLTGYTFEPRSIRGTGYGFNVAITEKATRRGLHIRIELEGIQLTRKQQRELARQLAIWKYGIRQAPEPSPFAQAFGLREFEMM